MRREVAWIEPADDTVFTDRPAGVGGPKAHGVKTLCSERLPGIAVVGGDIGSAGSHGHQDGRSGAGDVGDRRTKTTQALTFWDEPSDATITCSRDDLSASCGLLVISTHGDTVARITKGY
jgi:hypothetical protein